MGNFRFSKPLRSVAWSSLRHAYGKADDVPAVFEGWLSDDAETRDDAYHRVISALWHQGSIYPATGHAIPFLVELVCSAQAPCRGRAVTALALIALAAAREPDGPNERLVLSRLSKVTNALIECAVAEPAMRPMVLVVLSQVTAQSAIIAHGLRDLPADQLAILTTAATSQAAAFECIQRYSDESDV